MSTKTAHSVQCLQHLRVNLNHPWHLASVEFSSSGTRLPLVILPLSSLEGMGQVQESLKVFLTWSNNIISPPTLKFLLRWPKKTQVFFLMLLQEPSGTTKSGRTPSQDLRPPSLVLFSSGFSSLLPWQGPTTFWPQLWAATLIFQMPG